MCIHYSATYLALRGAYNRPRHRRYTIYKDHITLEDYEIHDGMGLELYYN